MGLFQLRIFRTSIFQQLGFLFSSQKTSARILLVGQAGVLSLHEQPLSTGYVENTEQRMSWADIQILKLLVPHSEHPVLPINERSLYPLDPYKKLTDEEKRNQASLVAIADKKYIEAHSNISEGKSETQAAKMAKTVLRISAMVVMVVLLGLFMRGCGH